MAPHLGLEPRTTRLTVSLPCQPEPCGMERSAGVEPSLTGLEDQHSHRTASPANLWKAPRMALLGSIAPGIPEPPTPPGPTERQNWCPSTESNDVQRFFKP